jgi:acetylornithine deacetylase/succinyl-diaminopimelate desuccinylase-like protein
MTDLIDWDAIRQDAAETLSRYVRFDTTNPPGNEMAAAQWVRDQLIARKVATDVTIHETAPGRGLVHARIPGREQLKPLLVNHHIDVVAADPTQWTHPPFSGAIADGYVWGRGTLDTKCLGVFFLLALESLIKQGARFRRPITFLAVPDEEAGGNAGMRWLIDRHLQELDPEWVWDEGVGGLRGVLGDRVAFGIAVAEKQMLFLRLVASGDSGHGSMPHTNNANVTLLRAIGRIIDSPRPLRVGKVSATMFADLAQGQKFPASFVLRELANPVVRRLATGRLTSDKMVNASLRDTVTLTVLQSGYKTNVIPEHAEARLDCRLLPDTDAGEFLDWMRTQIADERVSIEVESSSPPSGAAPLDSAFCRAAARAIEKHAPGALAFPLQVPGSTDGRFLRQKGYAAYGFAPVILTREDLNSVHGVDERISLENLELGFTMVRDMIQELCVD